MATKNNENLIFKKESYLIRGACFDLYKEFGGAFKESIINKTLLKALTAKGLDVETQKIIDVVYNGEKMGTYIPDIVVNDSILIELKTKPFLTNEDRRQFWYYLKASKYKLGFLINFGTKNLEIERRIFDKARPQCNISASIRFESKTNPRLSASKKGFSIIELLIAISLFVIIISMSVTIFLRALKTQKSALLLMESNDNVALAIEGMAREIRSGIDFKSNGSNLEFLEVVSGNTIKYERSGDYLLKDVKTGTEPDFTYQRITSEGVGVKNFTVILDDSPNYPPKVTLIISISPKNDALKDVTSNIQTTVSSRLFQY